MPEYVIRRALSSHPISFYIRKLRPRYEFQFPELMQVTTGRAQNTKQLILQQIHLGPSGNRQHGQTGQFEESLIQELLIKAWSGFRETSEGQDSTPGLAATRSHCHP